MNALLNVEGLNVTFQTRRGPVRAVDDVSFTVARGETVALVGESGSGKSTTALALQRLINSETVDIGGRVVFQDTDLLRLKPAQLRKVRGASIGMIFQDPSMALNPVFTIADQLIEPLQLHLGLGKRAALDRALALLHLVRVSDPETRLRQYPHNLSGGMRQRIMIAMALACKPALLIADEPTTALDVTVQAQVLNLIDELKEAMGMAVLLITHDLGVVWETADRVAVMYCGRIVEEGRVDTLLTRPAHPYTQGLLRAAEWDDGGGDAGPGKLFEIPGTVPSPHDLPSGCAFGPRCGHFQSGCSVTVPALLPVGASHHAACVLTRQEAQPS